MFLEENQTMTKDIKEEAKSKASKVNKDGGRPVKRKGGSKALRDCPIFQDIHDNLIKGVPVATVVKTTQERGYFTKTKQKTLQVMLERYLKSVPPAVKAQFKIPLITIRAMAKLQPIIDSLKGMQAYIEHLELKVQQFWGSLAKIELEMHEAIHNETDIEQARILAHNLYLTLREATDNTIEIIRLKKSFIEAQDIAGLIQRNLGTLDVNVVKYEASIREIARTRNIKVETIESLMKNPQSAMKVLDFVRSVRKADPAIIARWLKEDRKGLEEKKEKK